MGRVSAVRLLTNYISHLVKLWHAIAKSEQAQVGVAFRRVRTGSIRERTTTTNRIGSMLIEFGISFPWGHANMKKRFQWLGDKQAFPPLLVQELQNQHDYYN